VPILLGEFDEGCPQRLGGLLDELFEIDDVILVAVRFLEDNVDLLVLDEREAERIQCGLDLLLVECAVAILVRSLKE